MAKGSFFDGNVGDETQVGNASVSAGASAASAAAAAASAAAALVSEGLADTDAIATAADLVLTNADVVLAEADKVQTGLDKIATNADVVLTNADVVLTAADAAATALDKIATNADVVLTNADVVLAEADKVQTGLDRIATAADKVATNADVVLTNADVLSAEDSQLEANDWANRAENLLTRTFLNGVGTDRAAGNYSTLHWEAKTRADEILTNADAIATAADKVATNADAAATALDKIATNADVVLTNADVVSTAADAVLTAADVVSSAANAASAAAVYDGFDDRYLGSKAVAPTLDNDGNALVVGALYFDTVDQTMKVYTASGWVATSSATLATMERFVFTATAAQTIFTGLDDSGLDTLAIIVGAELVTLNGIVLEVTSDYTVTTSTITLTSGAALSDELNVYAFGNFEIANHYTKAAADVRFEPLDATIVKDADIGVTVQGYSAVLGATTASFLTADETKLDGIATSANNYVLPTSVVHDTETIDGGTY